MSGKTESFEIEELTLKDGLLGKLGGKLKQEYSQPISFGELKPSIQFVNKKEFYVSGNGDKNIEAAIVNVPKVRVKITKIYENNIVSYIKNYNFRSYNICRCFNNQYTFFLPKRFS